MSTIRLPARTNYDTLEDYIYQINHFDYSSQSFDAFKAILNSPIEHHHLEQCILWYNSFDQTLHHRKAEWDKPFKRAREERYVIDTDAEAARIADEKYRNETHAINRELWYKGNPPRPKNEAERTEMHMAALRADPERYADYLRANKPKVTEHKSKKKFSFWPFGGKTRKR